MKSSVSFEHSNSNASSKSSSINSSGVWFELFWRALDFLWIKSTFASSDLRFKYRFRSFPVALLPFFFNVVRPWYLCWKSFANQIWKMNEVVCSEPLKTNCCKFFLFLNNITYSVENFLEKCSGLCNVLNCYDICSQGTRFVDNRIEELCNQYLESI